MTHDIEIHHYKPHSVYKPKNDEEINNIATGIINGEYVASFQIPVEDHDLIPYIFFPLMFLTPIEKKKLQHSNIINFFGKTQMPVIFKNKMSRKDYISVTEVFYLNKTDTIKILNLITNKLKKVNDG
jgi:hypothetical protein